MSLLCAVFCLTAVFFSQSAAQDCGVCEGGHTCTLFGCVCPSNSYKKCAAGLTCDPILGCSLGKTCGEQLCTIFETCNSGKCTCGATLTACADEGKTCINGKCYCGKSATCLAPEICVNGECYCGVAKCEEDEECKASGDVYECQCDGQVCLEDATCKNDGQGAKCVCGKDECPSGTPHCIEGTCVAETCIDSQGFCSELSSYCKHPSYAGFMEDECKRTCGYCGSCTDEVGQAECEAKREYCYHKDYLSLMNIVCAKTCLLCKNNCTDDLDDGDEECKSFASYCADDSPDVRYWMAMNCRATCRYCKNDDLPCEDYEDNCVVSASLCKHEDVGETVRAICPATCKVC